MHNFEKAKILKNRHVQIVIEWGGVKNMFSHCSNMSIEGVVDFLGIMQLDNEDKINEKLTALIQSENDKTE